MVNYNYLRDEKAKALEKRENNAFIKKRVSATSYPDATIIPLRKDNRDNLLFGTGGVIDQQGKYVIESGIIGRVGGYYPFECNNYRDEKVVYCGYLINHWGHFLLEAVARLWYFIERDLGTEKYVFIVKESENPQISGNYRRFFELLGIADRIELINKPVKFSEVIIPELAYSRMTYYSNQFKAIFDRVSENALKERIAVKVEEKVYFSRGRFAKAINSEIGNDMLDHYFEKNGFKLLYPEELKLEEMIFYIRNAEICATPSGTLPHNFLFAQDSKKIVEVERMTLINEMQVDVDRIKNLDITYIDGHWLIYPGISGGGPFCYAYTRQFRAYSRDNGYLDVDEVYLSAKYKKTCIRRFLKVHREFFGYDWGMEKWTTIYAKALYEAHQETVEDLKEYICAEKPFLIRHYFQISYIKHAVKRILKR